MSEVIPVRPNDLLIDEVNPRLAIPNEGQRESQRALAKDLGKKVQVLAESIVEFGLDPTQLPIVMPSGDGRYIVLEGNRRLGALKALENPESLADAIPAGILKELRKLSKKYHESPIEYVQCLLSSGREEVEQWLELKHTGENEGAGIVKWGSDESGRFKARNGVVQPHFQALDFLTRRGDLTAEARKAIRPTNLQRLIQQPEVRERLGLELVNKNLYLRADEDRVAKALMWVVDHLPAVTAIHSKEQRVAWAKKIPANIAVKRTIERGPGLAAANVNTSQIQAPKQIEPPARRRDVLIPSDCVLAITDPRIRDIEVELRKLRLDRFTNAVSVLLRVFIELSTDSYIERTPLSALTEATLGVKLQGVASDLVQKRKLTKQQAKPVNRAVAGDSFLAPSVKLMHDYVHNQNAFPAPVDLIANWNSLQPFLAAIWV